MPRNGSGSYDLPITFVAGTPATAADQNTQDQDMGTALTQSLCTDGQSIMSGAIKGYAGTVGAPGYSFSSGASNGMYLAGAGQVGIATLGANVILFNNDQSITVPGVASFTSTANLNLPNGTTAQRPGSPTAGMARYNSTLSQFEYYSSSWVGPITNVTTQAASRGALWGLTLSNGTDTVNDINVSAGLCRDSSNVLDLSLPSGLAGKQLDASWAAGANAGMRSSAGLSDTTWFIFAIGKTDGTTDIFAHTALDPTSVLPTDYTLYRRIGCLLREGGSNVQFTQLGDYFQRNGLIIDISGTNPGTSATTQTLKVPIGIVVMALIEPTLLTGALIGMYGLVSSLDATDEAPNNSRSNIAAILPSSFGSGQMVIKTNTSGQIRTRVNASDANTIWSGGTRGWYDNRGINY